LLACASPDRGTRAEMKSGWVKLYPYALDVQPSSIGRGPVPVGGLRFMVPGSARSHTVAVLIEDLSRQGEPYAPLMRAVNSCHASAENRS
jgi:hypothetical protein